MSTEYLSYKRFESSSQVQDVEFAQVQIQVADGLKQGNEALKKMHEVYIKQVHTCFKGHINKVVQWVTCGLNWSLKNNKLSFSLE